MIDYIVWYMTKDGVKDFDYVSAQTYEKAYEEFMTPWMRRNLSCILSFDVKEAAE